jgi:Outer membrane protein beta-barrel domain
MKPISFYLIFCFFLFTQLHAQADTESDTTKINSLEQGSWSVQFRISNNFTLSSFSGDNISIKYHISANNALRFGLSVNGYDRLLDSNQENGSARKDDGKTNDFSILLRPHYLYYPVTNKNVAIFFGGGPYIYYDYNKSNTDRTYNIADTLFYTENDYRKTTRYYLGISIFAGVEIFILDNLSLHAEYGSVLYYSNYKTERTNTRDYSDPDRQNIVTIQNSKDDGYFLSSDNVLFGISIYF